MNQGRVNKKTLTNTNQLRKFGRSLGVRKGNSDTKTLGVKKYTGGAIPILTFADGARNPEMWRVWWLNEKFLHVFNLNAGMVYSSCILYPEVSVTENCQAKSTPIFIWVGWASLGIQGVWVLTSVGRVLWWTSHFLNWEKHQLPDTPALYVLDCS